MVSMCQIDVRWGMLNFKSLAVSVFELSEKNMRGGRFGPPPSGARVNELTESLLGFSPVRSGAGKRATDGLGK